VKIMMAEEYGQYIKNLHEGMKKLMAEALKAR